MKKILAAGGLVCNENDDLLMIFRRGKWDLPKGKLDHGELLPNCALREVQEETGLRNLELAGWVGITNHTYFDTHIHENVTKETHWYAMKSSSSEKLVPQTEEDITAIQWVSKAGLTECLQNTYSNIRQIIAQYLEG